MYQMQHQQQQQRSDNKEVGKSNKTSTVVDGEKPKTKINKALEELIDEKCNLLSKSGVSKEGSVHLAQWMKGQFSSNKNSIPEFEEDENSFEWSAEEVVKRSKELQLMHEIKKIDESEDEHSQVSQKSHQSTSKSTTSGSQVRMKLQKYLN